MNERRFLCIEGCSNCCRQPGTVVLTREDVVRLAAHLNMSVRRFQRNHTDRVQGRVELRLLGPERRCPFLGGDQARGWCNVHPAKPVQCATYPFWPGLADDDAAWEREKTVCPGIGYGPAVPHDLVAIQIKAAEPTATGR